MTENEARLILDVRMSRFDHAGDVKEALEIAKQALKEIQLYKDNKLCLIPKGVYSRQCSELDTYKEIGTVEECREAVEKQKPSIPVKTKAGNLTCRCGFIVQMNNVRYSLHYCTNCGQRIDWKGMEE